MFPVFTVFPAFPTFSGCVRPTQNCFLCCFSHFRIFRILRNFSDVFRIHVPLIFGFLPEFSGFVRLFPTCSGCVRPPQNCSPSCSSHFPSFSGIFPHLSNFLRLFPDACRRHNFSPFLTVLLNSGFFQLCPALSGCVRPPSNCSPSCSSHFRIFPEFSGFLRLFPTCSGCVRLPQNCSLCYVSHFRIFKIFRNFSDVFRMRTTATKFVPFMFLSFPDFSDVSGFSDFFRLVPDASDRHRIVFPFLFLSFPEFFRNFSASFQLFTTFSGCVPPTQFFPLPVLLKSGLFQLCPTFSGCVRPPSNYCSPSCFSHICMLTSSSAFPTFFRMRLTATKLFPLLFLSCSDFSGFFRLFRMRPTATKLFPFLFLSCLDFSDFSDLFRMRPTATKCTGPLVT